MKSEFIIICTLLFVHHCYTLTPSDTESTKCPGMYCGKTRLTEGNLSSCGSCPRGSRPDNTSLCIPCDDQPIFYDWLYLGFMALLAPGLNFFFIDITNKRKRKSLLYLHGCALLECIVSVVFTLLVTPPMGELSIKSCHVQRLSDWYTMLYNPRPDYTSTLHCTQEAVYPLYTVMMVYYATGLVCMMLIRPAVSAKLVNYKGTKSIYAALYFFPILIVIHAVLAGLIYYAFPFIVLVFSVITNAIHFSYFSFQDTKHLFLANVKEPRNLAIVLCHWVLHAYGIISITLLQDLTFHGPLLCLVPFPALFYLLTVKFTDPSELESVG